MRAFDIFINLFVSRSNSREFRLDFFSLNTFSLITSLYAFKRGRKVLTCARIVIKPSLLLVFILSNAIKKMQENQLKTRESYFRQMYTLRSCRGHRSRTDGRLYTRGYYCFSLETVTYNFCLIAGLTLVKFLRELARAL